MESKSILEHFGDLPDPREDNRRHQLIDIIAIVICASICGAEKWDDIESFGQSKEQWFRKFLELPHGIPSHDTFARVFAMLAPSALNERFSTWVTLMNPGHDGEIISIDGKTARGSYGCNTKAIHMVSAWASQAGLVLGQKRVDEKSNEIVAIPELLDLLELHGCVVTIDAIGTQRAIAEQIIDAGADYVLALKGNQGTLHEDAKLFFQDIETDKRTQQSADYFKTVDTDHGRIETREYWATEDIGWLAQKDDWSGLKSLCMVTAKRTVGESQSKESRFYISSLPADAKTLGRAIRAHWGIENSLHWILDVAFREDECRKRKDHSAENFAVLRHLTLNILKQETTCKRSIAGKRLLAGWDTGYMEKVLFKS